MSFLKRFIAERAAKALVGSATVFLVTNLQALNVEVPADVEAWLQQLLGTAVAALLTYVGVYRVPNKAD